MESSLEAFWALPETERTAMIESAIAGLTGDWQVKDGYALRGEDRFVFVPGGQLRMGFSPDEVLGLCHARRTSPISARCNWRDAIAQARPTRLVQIAPLLVAVHPDIEWQKGDRLPSEAELEWILRECGRRAWVGTTEVVTTRNRWKLEWTAPFGLEELIGEPQESSDYWGPGPREGRPVTRPVHISWQDEDNEIIALHAADRGIGPGVRRAVIELEASAHTLEASADPGPDALLAALEGSAKEAKAAWYALELLRGSPGEDCLPLIDAVVRLLVDPKLSTKKAAGALEWLGAMGWGPGESALECDRETPVAKHLASLSSELAGYLTHAKAPVRAAAMLPLTLGSADSLDQVAAHLASEKDVKVAANGLVGLALAGREAPPTLAKLDEKLEATRALAAAITGSVDVDALIAALEDAVVTKLLWFDGKPRRAATLLALGPGGDDIASTALDLLEAGGHAGALRDAVFGPLDPGPNRLIDPRALTEPQRTLLSELLQRRLPPPGARRSPLYRAMLSGEADESPFAIRVEFEGEPMPLYYALHELFAREQEGAIADRESQVSKLSALTIERLLLLNREAWKSAQGDLVFPGANPWDPRPPAPWPYTGGRFFRKVRSFPPEEREPFAATTAERIRAMAAEGQRIHNTLNLLAAATAPPSTIPDDIRETLTFSDLAGFTGNAGEDQWALDAFGEGWVEARIVEWMRPGIEDVLAGGKGLASRAMGTPLLLIGPDWSLPAIAAMAARDMMPSTIIGVYGYLSERPELRTHFDALPKALHALFRRGDPAWTGKLSSAKRNAALQGLLELMG